MKWRHSHKKRSRGVSLIMSRTNKMGRRRLSKMVMGDVHLSIYIFFRHSTTMKWRCIYKKRNGGVYLIMSHAYHMGRAV